MSCAIRPIQRKCPFSFLLIIDNKWNITFLTFRKQDIVTYHTTKYGTSLAFKQKKGVEKTVGNQYIKTACIKTFARVKNKTN